MGIVTGIIILVIGIILAAFKGYAPRPIDIIMLVVGVILAVVGLILIILGALSLGGNYQIEQLP